MCSKSLLNCAWTATNIYVYVLKKLYGYLFKRRVWSIAELFNKLFRYSEWPNREIILQYVFEWSLIIYYDRQWDKEMIETIEKLISRSDRRDSSLPIIVIYIGTRMNSHTIVLYSDWHDSARKLRARGHRARTHRCRINANEKPFIRRKRARLYVIIIKSWSVGRARQTR